MHSPALELYRGMLRIRRFEERLLQEFSRGTLVGTTHTYIGQEANAIGVLSAAGPDTIVVSNHRCHGHYIAKTGDLYGLAAEIMGKATGVCGGRGGSQHLHAPDFYSNGVLGGTVPNATGMAFAEKATGGRKIVICFLGDGAFGEGVVYESFNLASLWSCPVLYVAENNRYAQSTPVALNTAGSFRARFEAFGIPCTELDSTDVLQIEEHSARALATIRETNGPAALLLHTYRFSAHSKGDDTRDPAEVEGYRKLDPLLVHGPRLAERERSAVDHEVEREVAAAFERAAADPVPSLGLDA